MPVSPTTLPGIVPQNFPISLIPALSNQNTEFNAWCKPVGTNNRLKNPYNPAPIGPKPDIASPKLIDILYKAGHTTINIPDIKSIITVEIIGTKRFPPKNDKAIGNWIFEKCV